MRAVLLNHACGFNAGRTCLSFTIRRHWRNSKMYHPEFQRIIYIYVNFSLFKCVGNCHVFVHIMINKPDNR